MPSDYASDHRLDILILGPMSEKETTAASCVPVQKAVQAVLREPEFITLLAARGVLPEDCEVHTPERFDGQDIIDGVLRRLDIADLVIFNMTPKVSGQEASANVFYELGLVHALGIPAMIVLDKGNAKKPNKVPFYASGMKQERVADFSEETLKTALRPRLMEFLARRDPNNRYDNNRVTLFYGLPILDISAAAGLATGYYYNFVSRLITEGGFLGKYGHLIKQVVIVRPSSVNSTYQADKERLKEGLEKAGHVLTEKEGLEPLDGDLLGPLWFDHVQGIVVDIPRTIYPMQRSPRLLAFKKRYQAQGPQFNQRLVQFGDQLLDRVEQTVNYHILVDVPRVRFGDRPFHHPGQGA